MKIIFNRGTQEIGGTCMEIIANNGKRLWVDIGQPLDDTNPNTEYINNKPDCILISHPHRDHFGLLKNIPNDVPLYIGEISYRLMNATNVFIKESPFEHKATYFEAWKEFTILDTFKIKPHLTDHSSAEAFAFEIECDNERIFYSGDFRNGGAKRKVFDNICKRPPKDIDILFIEGTTIEREKADYPDETSVENKLVEIFKSQQNSSFVIGAGQNIDRIVALFRACKRTNKTLIIDPYIAYILKIVGTKSSNLPQADWEGIKVYNDERLLTKLESISEFDLMEKCKNNDVGNESYKNPKDYVYYVRRINDYLIDHIRKSNPSPMNIIYSQWTGYLKEENYISSSENIIKLREEDYINYYEIHASGHANREDILKLVQSINAKKVVPIHTSNAKAVKKYLNENGIDAVELWEDNTEYKIENK